MDFEEATCGHFIKRRHLATRWDENNAHAMCFRCNSGEENDLSLQDRHLRQMRLQYGQQAIDELYQKARQSFKISSREINEISKHYREKVKKL